MDNEENNDDIEIGATESRLLEAMSAPLATDDAADTLFEPVAEYSAYAGNELEAGKSKAKMVDIIELLKTITDPEIPINIYDMGLIYKIDQKDNADLYVEMTLTAPTCPIAGVIPQQVADALAALEGVGKVEVRLVWEPAWTPEKLSDDARELMELI